MTSAPEMSERPPEAVRPRSGRAAPLSAPERRAAIIEATIPLLVEHGTSVTTRQLAQAACVAEGTLFGVFADKDALIAEALEAALNPRPTAAAIGQIDRSLPLEDRLVTAVQLLQDRLAAVWHLLSAVGPRPPALEPAPGERPAELYARALASQLTPDCDALRHPPAACARGLLALTMGGSHANVVGDPPLAAAEIVDLVLRGILAPPPARPAPRATSGPRP